MDLPLVVYLIFILCIAIKSVLDGRYVAVGFSLLLFLFCAFFYFTRKPDSQRVSILNMLVLFILVLGMFAAFFGAFALVKDPVMRNSEFTRFGAFLIWGITAYSMKTGRTGLMRNQFKQNAIDRRKNPGSFWIITCIWISFGFWLFNH